MNILIIGNYGATNLGDELILLGLLSGIFEEFPEAEISVLTAAPRATEQFASTYLPKKTIHGIPRLPYGFRSLRNFFRSRLFTETKKAFCDADFVLLGGGGLFADDETFFAIPLWAMQTLPAIFYKKPIVAYGLGIGPITTRTGRYITGKLLKKIEFVGVRDEASIKEIQDITQGKFPTLTVDPIFLLKERLEELAASQTSHCPELKKPYIVISVRDFPGWAENLYKDFARLIDSIIQKSGLEIVFIPFQTRGDIDRKTMNKIIAHSSKKESIFCSENPSLPEICHVIKNAVFTLGMRLHANLLSLVLGKPFLPIIYSQKTMAFVESFFPELAKYALLFPAIEAKQAFSTVEAFIQNIKALEELTRNLSKKLYQNAKSDFRQLKLQIKR